MASKPIDTSANRMLKPFSSAFVTLGGNKVVILSDETVSTSLGVSCDAQLANATHKNAVKAH